MERSARIIHWIARNQRSVTAALALTLVSAFLAYGWRMEWRLGELPMNNGSDVWFVEGDPTLRAYEEFTERFGLGEAIVVAFHDPEGVVRPRGLGWVADVSRDLAALPWVEGVGSLSTLRACEEVGDELIVGPLFEAPASAADAKRVRARLEREPLLAQLLSDDGRTTLLHVRLRASDGPKERAKFLAAAEPILKASSEGLGDCYRWGGAGLVHQASNELTRRDAGRLGGLALLAGLLVLLLAFRCLGPVLLAGATVTLATTLLVCLAVAAGHEFNLITMIVPTLVLVIGVADAVYFVTAFREGRSALEARGFDRREVVARTLGPCLVPAAFNTLTTSVGFLGFLATDMAVLRQLGVLAALGLLLAFASTVTLCALVMEHCELGTAPRGERAWLQRWLESLVGVLVRRRRRLLGACVLTLLLALAGIARLEVDTNSMNQFWGDHPVREADRFIEEHYGPYLPFDVVIHTDAPGGAHEPELLRGLDAFGERAVHEEARLERAVSLAPLVKRLRQAFAADGVQRVPDTCAGVEQLLLLYDGGPDDPLGPLSDSEAESARVTLRVSLGSTSATAALLERLEDHARATLPAGARYEAAGLGPLFVKLNEYLVAGQIRSLGLTFAIVFLMIALLFRSLRYALVAVPPNLIPVVLCLGVMGHLGIQLDSATVIVGALVLAVSVDDTVHLLFTFRRVHQASGDTRRALDTSLRVSGKAVVVTSLTLAAGLGVLGLAGMRSVALFGLLFGLGILVALVCELVLTPLLLLAAFPQRDPVPVATPAAEPSAVGRRYRVSARLQRASRSDLGRVSGLGRI